MKLKVLTQGTCHDIRVVDADTGEPVEGVQRVNFTAARGELPTIQIIVDIFEVEASTMEGIRNMERDDLGLPKIPGGIKAGLKKNPFDGVSVEMATFIRGTKSQASPEQVGESHSEA